MLRIGLETIFALKDYDKSALQAYHSWLALADFQSPGIFEVNAWIAPSGRIEAALCIAENLKTANNILGMGKLNKLLFNKLVDKN